MCLRALLHLSINLSGPTLSDPTFLDWLVVQIDSSGVPGDWLEFERPRPRRSATSSTRNA
jgi:EAL domain-containing protein (putative c-di-GMP-specific phosphodiesterase class I)